VLAAPGSGKTVTINPGTPTTFKLILMSTDTSTDSTSTFFGFSASNGTTNVNPAIQIGNASSGTTQVTFNSFVNASNFVLNGDITDSPGSIGSVRITGNSTGIVNYATTPKTYSGTTTIAGILKINTDNMIPHGAGKSNVVLEGTGQLQLNNTNEIINGLDSTSNSAAVSKSGSNTRTLQIGDNNANGNYAGGLTLSGGSSAVTKIGSGTQKFGNINIPGAFTTSAGTSIINGTLAAPSASTAASATLGGTGIANLTGAFTMNGNLAPGDQNTGVFNVATTGATFGATASYQVEIGGATPSNGTGNYDQTDFTNASGAVSLNAATSLSVSLVNSFTPSPSDIYYILTRADSAAFSTLFAGTTEGGSINLPGGGTAQITYQANWTGTQAGSTLTGGNDIALYNVVVPEPAGLSLLALGAMGTLRRRRVK
jgi:hypothetical protein